MWESVMAWDIASQVWSKDVERASDHGVWARTI